MYTRKPCLENANLNACCKAHSFSILLTKGSSILKESQVPIFTPKTRWLCRAWQAALMSRNGAKEDLGKHGHGQSQHTPAFCASHFLYQCTAHSSAVHRVWTLAGSRDTDIRQET